MDNSLLDVRDINHKYIVVGKEGCKMGNQETENTKSQRDLEEELLKEIEEISAVLCLKCDVN